MEPVANLGNVVRFWSHWKPDAECVVVVDGRNTPTLSTPSPFQSATINRSPGIPKKRLPAVVAAPSGVVGTSVVK